MISHLEHHANIVPWQQLAEQTGAKLKVIPVDDDGQLLLDAYSDLLTDRTRLVAVSQVSNVLGTIVPVSEVIAAAHRAGARVLIDGAQAIAHLPVDVQAMDADFYVFSGHKVFAPTGIGVLYGKPEVLESMPPWQGGGNMIQDVTFERTSIPAAACQVRGGHRQHRRCGRARHRAGLREPGSACRASRATSTSCSAMPPGRCGACQVSA